MPIYTPGKVVLAKQFTWNETVWNPSMIQTALWLDAADSSTVTTVSGAVSQWNDKSGNVRTFAQSNVSARPVLTSAGLNGKNVITFGSGLFIGGATASDWGFMHGSQCSILGVAAPSSTANPGINQQILGTRASGLNPGLQLSFRDASPQNEGFAHRVIRSDANSAVDYYTGDNTHPAANAATIYTVLSDPANVTASSRSQVRFNGGSAFALSTESNAPTSSATAPQFALRLGNDTASMTGYWAELVVTSSLLSVGIHQRIEGYLAHKWGLTANLPSNHPYKTVGPTP
ncbi:hypothetical protein SSRP02_p007 [Synechococcus phage S-SRP02]|nr:hypothetical protein SSRP02_p007 [Synechococcus phage S-SRP02]